MCVCVCVELVCSTWYIRWVSCVCCTTTCWSVECSVPSTVCVCTVYRYSTCVSDTHAGPVRHSLIPSVSQSVSQFGIWHARKQLPNMVVAVSVCVCAAVYDCNTFLRMSTWPWPRPPPSSPLAVICGFLPAWCCLAKSYWIVIAATCDKSMTTKVDKWSTEWGVGGASVCECVVYLIHHKYMRIYYNTLCILI